MERKRRSMEWVKLGALALGLSLTACAGSDSERVRNEGHQHWNETEFGSAESETADREDGTTKNRRTTDQGGLTPEEEAEFGATGERTGEELEGETEYPSGSDPDDMNDLDPGLTRTAP